MKQRNNFIISAFILMLTLMTSCGGKEGIEDIKKDDQQGKSIIETGELAAIDSRSFVMQRYGRWWYQMKIIGILKHGTEVKAGDSIIQLDPTEIKKYIIDRESQLETEEASLQKLIVNLANRKSDLQSRFESETATFNLRKLELESSRFESERIRKIKQLEFNQANLNYNKTKKVIEFNKKIAANELKIQQLRVNELKTELRDAKALIPQLTIKTPISGIFQIADNRRTGMPIKIGDELYQGNNMGNVPDLTNMKVVSSVNENDYRKVRLHQKVIVRLDAMPKLKFMGEISYIGKLCHLKNEKSKQKVFDVEVRILKSDARLKPGMTVSCEYLQN